LRFQTIRPAALLACTLLMAGCGSSIPGSAMFSALSSPAVPPPVGGTLAATVTPSDPLAAFAMATPAGNSGSVSVNGIVQPARVVRVYHAASGRECRELVLGAGGGERAQVVCSDPEAGLRLTPPLLRSAR